MTRPKRRRSGQPTVNDVARLAQCSSMTVSRVINGETAVRDSTRARVQAAIAELNFSPNRAARSLAGGAQIRLALLYANPSASYLSELLMGSLDEASRQDIHLVVERCEFGRDEARVIEGLVAAGIDGFILPSPLCEEEELLAQVTRLGARSLQVGPGRALPGHSAVMIDEYRAAFDMTRHLLALGHRRIGFIVGNRHQSASLRRLEGFRDAMAGAGLGKGDALEAQGAFTYRSGLDAAEALLGRDDPPSAIFASNDDMAAAAVAVAHRRQLDVPGDLTVCGFDDTAMASTIWPELTTIRQPIADLARRAVAMLAAEIRSARAGLPAEARNETLEYALVRRQSDAPPRSA